KLTEEVIQRPLDAEVRYELGALLIRLGREPHGARWLASALALNPAHPAARRALADCLPRLTDPAFAEHCRRLVADRGGIGPRRPSCGRGATDGAGRDPLTASPPRGS